MDPVTIAELISGGGTMVETIRNLLLLRDMPLRIMLSACIHYLATTPVATEDGQVRAKWEVVRIVEDEPLATTWEEFCRVHLGMCPTTASRYKRTWEVFVAATNLTAEEQCELPARLCKASAATGRAGFVYLFSSKELGFKIGRTTDIVKRLQALIRELNIRIGVVCSGWFDDCVGAERTLHERFRDKRTSGEWFELSEDDVEAVWRYVRQKS